MRPQQAGRVIARTLNANPHLINEPQGDEESLYDALYDALWPNNPGHFEADPYLEEMAIDHLRHRKGYLHTVDFRLTETRRGEDTHIAVRLGRSKWNPRWQTIAATRLNESAAVPPVC